MARRKLTGLHILLTGASSGIGRELAIQLIEQGADIIAVARRADRLQQLADTIQRPEQFTYLVADVTNPADRQRAIAECQQRWGGLDVLINNAGSGAIGPFSTADEARLRRVMEVNFFAPVELTRLALPLLRRGTQPIIVNVSSVLAHRGVPQKTEYCASKFALHGFSDALRAELAKDKIDVLLVSPSTTATEFFDKVEGDLQKPHGRFGARSAAYVASAAIRALRAGRHEVILSTGGRLLVWLDRLCPPLADRLVAWWG
ncbi:putative oxidoreductase [Anatilimnocola aggregata]|uniref:Putative oxidoreductase n=1 Tax=Anatilimnocola aggregata TaxID=2528021 RepID=A0A517YL50_9BACT|nr:SDR family NAD(P)-dependent oxidoreductase [Anatilimnocola aggregata]QDU30943.1 putative oxidoreductase [Anatilimnocola aggregata]